MSELKAAIFDIGGVLTASPVTRIKSYCAEWGISDELRTAIFAPNDAIWSRFERSELTLELDRACECDGRGLHFLEWFFQGFEPRPEMVAVVQHLRGRTKLGSITNNVARDLPAQQRTSGLDIQSLFDVVVESAIEGV